ncbi:MAG: glycosyltransferase [Acidimicrobiia bacterium]|nr:glycosyltransferase [Acidimicrobiia bacterium]
MVIRRIGFLSMHTSPLGEPGSGDAGGLNVYVRGLALAMLREGIEVDVYTRRTDPSLPGVIEVEEGFRVHHLSAGPAEPLTIAEQIPWARDFADEVLDRLSTGPRTDLVHSHYWLSGWVGALVKRKLGLPHVISFHTLGRVKEVNRRGDDKPEPLVRIVTESEVVSEADCIIASTPDEADDLLLHYGASPESLCVTPPGVDRSIFSPDSRSEARSQIGVSNDNPLVLFVGRIQPLKGLDIALKAFNKVSEVFSDASMMVVGGASGGSGEEEIRRAREYVQNQGLRVEFRNAVPHSETVPFYRAADVIMMPSRTESFGLVAVEAQSCGLPVVASDVGGLGFVVADGVSGLLVKGWEPEDHAAAVERILADQDLASDLSSGAREWSERFDWKVSVDRFLELYEGALV